MTTKEVLDFFAYQIKKNKSIKTLELSGGEPTIRKDFFDILYQMTKKYPYLDYTLLSNGRMLSNYAFAKEFSKYNISHAIIPLHHWDPNMHDQITRAKGSFIQTCQGIKNISQLNIPMTIKIIVTKMNYTAMPKIIEFIAKNFPLIKEVSINGLDIRARAKTFKDMVAVSFTDYIPYAQKAIDIAKKYSINIVLYSIPLCVLDEKYRIYCGEQPDLVSLYKTPAKEIQNKTEDHGYVKECYSCKLNKTCYGTWFSYYDVYGTGELKPIKKKGKRNIVFKICGSCNNDCLFCYEYGSQPEKDESLTDLKKKIDNLQVKKEDCVILVGGEPTINKDIFFLINHIKKYTSNIHITTNGRRIKDMSFLKKLIDFGISEFCVYLHAPFSKLHDDTTRKKNSFSETIEGLQNLKKSHCKTSIKIVITKLNYKFLYQTVKYINENFSNKTKIIFSNLSLNGSAMINKKIISVKGSLVAPYLDDSIDYCIKEKMPFQIDMFPICILKNYKYLSLNKREKRDIDEIRANEEIGNNMICKTCANYQISCDGVWASYIKEYGISEFEPKE